MGKVAGGAHGEVALAAAILDYYAQHGEAFMTPASVPGAPGAKVLTLPLGILLAVEPWNFPYYQVARVVGPQLMVGNVVMLKHAENVPQCALAFAELLESEIGRASGRERVGQYVSVSVAADTFKKKNKKHRVHKAQ